MKLTFEDTKKLIFGAVDIIEEDGHILADRIHEEQRRIFEERPILDDASRTSASVRLDMVTDSDFIGMEYLLMKPLSVHKFGGFDVYVDGILLKHFFIKIPDYLEQFGNTLAVELPEGSHRVTVYLPWSVKTYITGLFLSDGATFAPAKYDGTYLALGDSITQGHVNKMPSLSYVNRVARELNYEAINQAVGGYLFNAGFLSEVQKEIKPDLITVAYGTNNYTIQSDLETVKAYATAYLTKLRSLFPDTRIIGIIPIYRNDHRGNCREIYRGFTMDDVRKMLTLLYEDLGIEYVAETHIPHDEAAYAPDQLHPSDFGSGFIAQAVLAKI